MLEALDNLAVHGYGFETAPAISPMVLSKLGLDNRRQPRESRSFSSDRRGFNRPSRPQGGRGFDRGSSRGGGFDRRDDRGGFDRGFKRNFDRDSDRKPSGFGRKSDGFGSGSRRDSFDFDNLARKGIV